MNSILIDKLNNIIKFLQMFVVWYCCNQQCIQFATFFTSFKDITLTKYFIIIIRLDNIKMVNIDICKHNLMSMYVLLKLFLYISGKLNIFIAQINIYKFYHTIAWIQLRKFLHFKYLCRLCSRFSKAVIWICCPFIKWFWQGSKISFR